MESILNQCPEGMTLEELSTLYERNNSNVTDVLTEAWKICPVIKNKPIEKNREVREKWNEIRDICNTYEEEMAKAIDAMKNNNAV